MSNLGACPATSTSAHKLDFHSLGYVVLKVIYSVAGADLECRDQAPFLLVWWNLLS